MAWLLLDMLAMTDLLWIFCLCSCKVMSTFKHGIYWCIREDETNLSDDLRHLLWKDRVYYVPIKGFDELMSTLNHSLTGQLPINRKMLSSEHHKELIGKLTNNKYIKSLQENPFYQKRY